MKSDCSKKILWNEYLKQMKMKWWLTLGWTPAQHDECINL